jgi:hypothetical protein
MKPRPTSAIGTVQRWNEPEADKNPRERQTMRVRHQTNHAAQLFRSVLRAVGGHSVTVARNQPPRQQAVYVPRGYIGLVPAR